MAKARQRGERRGRRSEGPTREVRRLRQRLTIRNAARGTSRVLIVDRLSGRLSRRQERETFQALVPPGFRPAGVLGEWPLRQEPPEYPGVEYVVVELGVPDEYRSNLYLVPVGTAEAMVRDQGARLATEEPPRRMAAAG